MSKRAAVRYLEMLKEPMFRLIGLLAAWYLFGKAFEAIFTVALNTLYPGANYG
jgi:hypothetical protein